MSGPQLTVTVIGGRRVRRELQRKKRVLLNRAEPHIASGRLMEARTLRRIREGKTFRGRRVAPLKESTIQRRRRAGISSQRVLIERGRLLRSIRFEVRRGRETVTIVEPEAKRERGKLTLVQRGLRGRGGGVKRESLGINTTDERDVRKIFSDFIQIELDKIGR